MQRWTFRMLLLLVGFAGTAGSTVARAGDWYPLDLGLYWDYHDPQLLVDVHTSNVEFDVLRGRDVVRRVSVESPNTANELWNYWSVDQDQRVYLHGFWRPTEIVGLEYEPPILWFDPTAADGGTWSTTVGLYDFVDQTYFGQVRFDGQRIGTSTVTVPVGTFDAVLVTLEDFAVTFGPSQGRFSLSGRSIDGSLLRDGIAATYIQWYVDGIGIVQEARALESVIIRALTGSNVPVALERANWSRLKVDYRRSPR